MILVENPKLLDCRFKNGMMILPYYHSIISSRLNHQPFAGEGARPAPIKKRLMSLLAGLKYCRVKRKDILIFSSTLFNVHRDGGYFNSLHGYYYNLYPKDTLLIEDSDNSYMWRTKDSCENLSLINTYIELLCRILQKICHAVAPIHRKDYELFVEEYPELFNEALLSKADYFTRFYAFFIQRLLKRVKPKVVLLNCASYGHTKAIICFVSKKLGIKIIEPQHGVTYYNFGYVAPDFVVDSLEYREYLPDALFTFGDYWKAFVRWKFEMVSVGNPYLNEHVAISEEAEEAYDFLVISQPMNDEEEREKEHFVKSLSVSFPEKKILFRIHPAEDIEQQRLTYKEERNVAVSNSAAILYGDICKSKYVIGWFSTCLYECLAFKRVPIIVDTPSTRLILPPNIGIWVKNPEEIKTIDFTLLKETTNYSEIWSQDFENKVRAYYENNNLL